MSNNEIYTQNYRITHSVAEPSKMSDYDYDPDKPYRRFVSTYLHTLKISDRITDQELISLKFSSETCAQIIIGLYGVYFKKYSYNDAYPISPDPNMSSFLEEASSIGRIMNYGNITLTTINSVYINDSIRPGSLVISKNPNDVQFSVINAGSPIINFNIYFDDAGNLLSLLEREEMENMFVSYDDENKGVDRYYGF